MEIEDAIKNLNTMKLNYHARDKSVPITSLDMGIEALEKQMKINEAIKILQTVDWVGSGAKARIQEAIKLLT